MILNGVIAALRLRANTRLAASGSRLNTLTKTKPLHDHVAKHHVEQQLFVGPSCPARRLCLCVMTLRFDDQR
jgi:hypothetical protein